MMFDSVIEKLNVWGDHLARIAWLLFWQSSLLIVGMFLVEIVLRRRLRPSVRHALWLVVLVKLLLPPSFALPSGIGWWLRPREVAPGKPPVASYIVTYGPGRAATPLPAVSYVPVPAPRIRLSSAAWALFGTAGMSVTILLVILRRWRNLRHQLRISQPAPIWLEKMVHDARRKAGCRRRVRLMLTDASMSPALCGLFRPMIVLPIALVQQLRPEQLRGVLLHELFHLRNGDVWVNCFQSLLQIVFWWHPFLWLANARIRRIREEVVDDSVRLALAEEAETYAPTLLEVARLALARPLATLGLIGILESRHALKQRVDRLVNFPAPRRVGLSIISGLAILAFASVALPMGQAPPRSATPIRREAPTIYYKFDQSFLSYFGSNGVDAVIQTLAQSNPGSRFLRYPDDSSVGPSQSEHFNSQPAILNNGGAILHRNSPVDTANSAWEFHPLTENGFIEYDLPSGIGTATNGAVVKHGGTTISADNITVNQQTGEVLASGSVKIQTESNPTVAIESDYIKYNAATGAATATRNAVLRQGDRVVARADNITFDATNGFLELTGNPAVEVLTNAWREAGEVIVNGHFDTKSTSGNTTNLQLAQVQPSLINSPRTLQTTSGRKRILNKLEAIRLDHVAFDNLPLSEVVNNLRDEAKKRDPEGKGINFILNPNADLAGAVGPPALDPATGLQVATPQVEPADINAVAIRILPPLNDVRMIDVLDAITKVADKRIRYSIEDYGVSFWLAGNTTTVPLFTRVIKVDPNVFAQGLESVVGFSVGNFQTGGQGGGGQGNSSGVTVPRVQVAPNAIGGQGGQAGAGGAQGGGGISGVTRPRTMTNQQEATQQAVRQFFANAGVDLTPPKSVFFNDRAGDLLVHATLNDFDIIEKAVVALNAGSDIAPTGTARPTTASVTETSSKPASPQTNLAKVPLGDLPVVGKALTRTVEVSAANSPRQIPNASASNTEKLLTKTMEVDPITFSEWVRKTAGLGDKANSQERMDAFRKILLDRGLQLAPPANVIYNDRNGILFVRAIRSEMDVIEQIVQELNRSSERISPQANPPIPVPATNHAKVPALGDSPVAGKMLTRTVEVVKVTSPAMPAERLNHNANDKLLTRSYELDMNNFFAGVQWEANVSGQPSRKELLAAFGKLLQDAGVRLLAAEIIGFDDRGKLFVRATGENMEAIENKVQALSVPPPQINIKVRFVEIAKGDTQHFLSLLQDLRIRHPVGGAASSATTARWDTTNALAEVLTEEQFRDLLRAAEKRDGADLLTEAAVTTLSGRQAQIQIADMKTILTKVNPQALVPPGVSSSNVFNTENVSLGPVLDVIPIVADDGMTVSLDVTATITGFVGYGRSAEAEDVQVYVDGNPQSTKPPLPHFRVRQMHTAATVTDGQTLLLGNPTDVILRYDKDGNGSGEPGREKKDLLAFVTTTIVDPAGNPVHNSGTPSVEPEHN